MTGPSALPPARSRVVAKASGVLLALTGCGGAEEEAPLSDAPAEVPGGAVGPDVRLNDDHRRGGRSRGGFPAGGRPPPPPFDFPDNAPDQAPTEDDTATPSPTS